MNSIYALNEQKMIADCVNCDKEIDIDEGLYVVGESLGEYWCLDCAYTATDER